MSDYFDRFEREIDAVIERRRDQPWYRRIATARRGRAGLAVAAACVVMAAVVLLAAPFGPADPGHAATPVATVAQGPGPGVAGHLSSLRVAGAERGELREADSRACGTASQTIEDTSSIDASLPRPLSSTGS
jgi:hypothetical protein